jgi:hypothetical protein
MHIASRRVRKTLEPDLDNASEGKLTRNRIASRICIASPHDALLETSTVLETS